MMNKDIHSVYGNRVRVRVCGLCWKDDQLLMINHHVVTGVDFWAPPGGGMEFGQSAEQTLIREFHEETQLEIVVGGMRFITEFRKPPLHAVELFFDVNIQQGELKPGIDPEMSPENQIIRQIEFMDWSRINALEIANKHGLFRYCKNAKELKNMSGYYGI